MTQTLFDDQIREELKEKRQNIRQMCSHGDMMAIDHIYLNAIPPTIDPSGEWRDRLRDSTQRIAEELVDELAPEPGEGCEVSAVGEAGKECGAEASFIVFVNDERWGRVCQSHAPPSDPGHIRVEPI